MVRRTELLTTKLDDTNFEVWIRLDKRHLDAFKEAPTELIGNARLLLAGLKSQGKIEAFELYDELFEKVWERFTRRGAPSSVKFIIAAGYPKLEGVTITRSQGEERSSSVAFLNISAPRNSVARWRPEWLIRCVNKELKTIGVKSRCNAAQIHCLWLQAAINGESIGKVGFGVNPTAADIPEKRGYAIRTSKQRQEVDIYFSSFKDFQTKDKIDQLLAKVHEAVRRLAADPGGSGFYIFLREHVRQQIQACRDGAQGLGIQLPASILGGVAVKANLLEGDLVKGIPPGAGSLFMSIMREMLKLRDSKFEAEWFGERFVLALAQDSIQELMTMMRNRGLVERTQKNGHWLLASDINSVGYRICGKKCDDFHRSSIMAASGALANYDMVRLAFQSARYCVNEDSSLEMIDALKDFRDDLIEMSLEQSDLDQVYQVNLQLFPLTRLSPDYRTVSLEKHQYDSEGADGPWLDAVMFDLSGLENFRNDPKWVVAKLIPAVNQTQATQSLERLKQLGLLTFDPAQNKHVRAKGDYLNLANLDAKAKKVVDQKMIELALGALDPDYFTRREFSTTIVAVKEDDGEKLRDLIKELYRKLFTISQKSLGSDQIYQVNLQMVPHTK